ncbi:MAG: tetratricopeptide repeat protein [Verrucomicrobia bacterium]|nr:tetratricopeptide repeat protein [Verrucomicrobiota bacterium]
MNRILLPGLCGLLLGMPPVSAAASPGFEQANRQFQAGDCAAAAAAYEKILAADGARAAVFYNLGNSYQRLGQYGHAILAYERARLLTPRDPDLLANLALARKAAAAFEENGNHPRLDAAVNYLSRNEWSWLVAGAALFLGGLAVLGGVLGMPRSGMRQTALTAAGMAALAIMAGATALYHRRDEASRGVVLTENAAVRLSPFDKAETLGSPGLGRTVHIRSHNGGFHYIEVPGTHLHGWLPIKDVAAIMPEMSRNERE